MEGATQTDSNAPGCIYLSICGFILTVLDPSGWK